MPDDTIQPQESLQSLIDGLVAALYLRPWIDVPEDRIEVRKQIVRRIRAGEATIAPILPLLDHDDWAVRHEAAEILGRVEDREAARPLLVHLWLDRSTAVRGSIALALERIGAPDALAEAKEYARTIRSYPEVIGRLAELADPDVFNAARQSLTSGISIRDMAERGFLAFDLADLLAVSGERARAAQWCCQDVECTGESTSEMHAIDDEGLVVSGRTLVHIALTISRPSMARLSRCKRVANPG